MFKKISGVLVAVAPGFAFATPGSDAVTAITAAQTDALLVVGALLAISVAIWGGLYIKRKFFG